MKFESRHIGNNKGCIEHLNYDSDDALIKDTIPKSILEITDLKIEQALSESEALAKLKKIAQKNKIQNNFIGQGFYGCITPAVILRNLIENPSWYTQYTPYQAEISQGRLESLLNFQTMIVDLMGLDVANASLLDEATAAAEAVEMFNGSIFVDETCFESTISVVTTRASSRGRNISVGKFEEAKDYKCVLFQSPNKYGFIDPKLGEKIKTAKEQGAKVVVASDLLSACIHTPPGDLGADIAVGSAQRFGVPMGYGGPSAGFIAVKKEMIRKIPGRMVGISKDSQGDIAYRLALQTREQHIRREKATSNICTAQALLANVSAMYAVFHGPTGLCNIAKKVNSQAKSVAEALNVSSQNLFDTVTLDNVSQAIKDKLEKNDIEVFWHNENQCSISVDETTTFENIDKLLSCFGVKRKRTKIKVDPTRKTPYLTHPVFNSYHSETECMRYIHSLAQKDLSLTHSMIPLGSCTMKLNAAAELQPLSWPEFNQLHPYTNHAEGYKELIEDLGSDLCAITGFDHASLTPNSGAQGELAGLVAISKYLKSIGENNRNICLIPSSAHGTNPASAVMAGMIVKVVACDVNGNIDITDLTEKCRTYATEIAALMVTYPSTHGVFEKQIKEICALIHNAGGQVYMDGANLNAQLGLCFPARIGADVCHLNLHKTFCIPHGGGGPGVGPIAVKPHLEPFLPSHPILGESSRTLTAAPYGSASILPISWMYIKMMGEEGLRQATKQAIVNANYIAKKLSSAFKILYRGESGNVAHECIVDLRMYQSSAGITVEDIAKRLMDFGFHAPTIAWPVAGTMMIEPTESESKHELDRFCDAMLKIHEEMEAICNGEVDKKNNLLKNAPHTTQMLASDTWNFPYTRNEAVFPLKWVRKNKFWPAVSRIDSAYGDRNPQCSCLPISDYE